VKIALCVFALNLGGIGTLLDVLRRGFAREGHEANILTTWRAGNYFAQAQAHGWPVKNISNNEISLKRRIKLLYDELSEGYDAVILNHSHEGQLVLPAIQPRIIRLAVQHNATSAATRSYLLNHQHYDAWIGVSPPVTDAIRKCCKANLIVQTIPNGVNAEAADGEPRRDEESILYVGRIDERDKNVLILPRVAAELKRLGDSTFTFRVAGIGPVLTRLKQSIATLRVQESFTFLDYLDRAAVLQKMREHEYLILPSRREGLPFVLIEAMGCGAVPVTSDILVHQWLLDADAQYLAGRVDDFSGYAQRIHSLSKRPALRAGIRARLARRQGALFSEEACFRAYKESLRTVRSAPRKHIPVPIARISLPWMDRFKSTWLFYVLKRGQMRLAAGRGDR
jgi:glycosyltransferase involved in cell wall biosynthesis